MPIHRLRRDLEQLHARLLARHGIDAETARFALSRGMSLAELIRVTRVIRAFTDDELRLSDAEQLALVDQRL